MRPYLFTGPLRPNEVPPDAEGVLLDFIPFRKNSVSEADAKKIKDFLPASAHRLGFFDRPGLNQLLYLLSEDLINGAIIANIGEKDLRRVAETTKKPLFSDGTCKDADTILREQRMPVFGHYFQILPEREILSVLKKPWILSISEIDTLEDILAAAKENMPFALRLETPALTAEARRIIEKTERNEVSSL